MQGQAERVGRWTRFDSSCVEAPSRTPTWERMTRDLLLPLQIESRGPVSGFIAGRRIGAIRHLRLESSAHYGVRTGDLAAGQGAGHLAVAYALSGRLEVRQYGRSVTLAPGECAVYDTSDEFAVGSRLPFGAYIAMVPTELLNLSAGVLAHRAARQFEPAAAERMRQLLRLGEGDPTRVPFEDLTRLVHDAVNRVAYAERRSDAQLVEAVCRLVDTRLNDARLGPDFIAGVIGVSRRRLYYACVRELGPLAAYIRQRRLEHARSLLNEPEWGTASIAEIAIASGFDDQAHFSRLFSRRFGTSPLRLRRFLSEGPGENAGEKQGEVPGEEAS